MGERTGGGTGLRGVAVRGRVARAVVEAMESRQMLSAAVPWAAAPLVAGPVGTAPAAGTGQPRAVAAKPQAVPVAKATTEPAVAKPVAAKAPAPTQPTAAAQPPSRPAPRVAPVTPATRQDQPAAAAAAGQPSVVTVTPADAATGVLRDAFVRASVNVPNGAGVDPDTVTAATVYLTGPGGGLVPAAVNTSGGGDVLVLAPAANLAANTTYTFTVTAGVKDLTGAAFVPFTSSFTTGATAGTTSGFRFTKTLQSAAPAGKKYTGVTFGPDGKLYATALSGEIYRFAVGPTGTLALEQTITTISARGRYLIGLAFDPASTPTNLIAWATHTQAVLSGGADWASTLTKLTGPDLQAGQDAVVGLPRSKKDHLSNQIAFGPDGALYFSQGANNAMGGPDSAWGFRLERLLSASTLRVDVAAINQRLAAAQGPLNVRTQGPTSSGSTGTEPDDVPGVSAPWTGTAYDPFAPGAPLTIYATGVRNAYDLVWAQTNGQWNLYTATNGSAPGGTIPATPAPGTGPHLPRVDSGTAGGYVPPGTQVNQITNANLDEADHLYRIRGPVDGVPAGGVPYLGHPNPVRHEYVLNGGNPTNARDRNETNVYPVGVQPDRNYRNADAYEFTNATGSATDSVSANGMVQYRGTAFGGAMTGRLLIIAYSSNKEIYAARIGPDGAIVPTGPTEIQKAAIFDAATNQSMRFTGGLDLTEDPSNGNLYVADHDGAALYLLSPVDPDVATDKARLIYSDATASPASAPQRVTIVNNGTTPLTITGASLAGTNAANFTIVAAPAAGTALAPGASTFVDVTYAAAGGAAGAVHVATLNVATNDADTPTLAVSLRGLVTSGYQGGSEPTLAKLLELYQANQMNVGGTSLALPYTFTNGQPTLLGQEVVAQRFVRAGAGPVSVQPLATYGPDASPDYTFGYYAAGTAAAAAKTVVYTAETPAGNPPLGGGQTATPVPTAAAGAALAPSRDGPAAVQFDPGAGAFGLYAFFTGVDPDLTAYTEDGLNTRFDGSTPAKYRRVRFWPLRDAAGAVVPNAYVGGIEEASNNDLQDVVFVVRNVAVSPVDTTPPRVAGIAANGGSIQRSMVTSLAVAFDRPVGAFDAGAFVLTRRDPAGGPATPVPWTAALAADGLRAVLTFAGADVVSGSLPDGHYDLLVRPSLIRGPAGQTAAGADQTYAFHRLFADADGDRDVDGADSRGFRGALGSELETPAYNPIFDFDGDGDVDGADSRAFRRRLGTEI